MELCINEVIDDVAFDVKLDTKVCILYGDSGTGKTYLTEILMAQAMKNNLSFVHFDFNAKNMPKEAILASCKDKSLVIFDDADIYLDKDIVLNAEKCSEMLIICIHDISGIPCMDDCARYLIDFTDSQFRTRKRKG